MSEDKTLTSGAKKIFSNAVKAVRGDNTNAIIEEFTSEMTLVAEGLCEDQAKLRKALDDLTVEQDRRSQRFESDVQAVEQGIRENQRDLDQKLNDIGKKIRELENRQNTIEQMGQNTKKEPKSLNAIMKQATILVSIACGAWVLVSILSLFK